MDLVITKKPIYVYTEKGRVVVSHAESTRIRVCSIEVGRTSPICIPAKANLQSATCVGATKTGFA